MSGACVTVRTSWPCNFDTPTAGSGGILASTRLAWCPRSYDRSTSVLLLRVPHSEGVKSIPLNGFQLGYRQETIRE